MIVLDTPAIIWDALKPELLSDPARQAIDRANRQDGIIFCDISLWEIAMLIKKKRLQIDVSYTEFIRLVRSANHYTIHEITPEIADLSVSLPADINLDPADRLICATAQHKNAALVTADSNLIQAKAVDTIW